MSALTMQAPLVDPTVDMVTLLADVSKAKSLLILDRPFYGMAVSKRPIIYTDTVATAAMSAKGQMYMNPAWCSKLTVRNLMFLLAHEALHYMLCHSTRMGNRKHTAWNIACDKVINDLLVHDKVGVAIPDGVYMDGARDLSAEQLYNEDDDDGDGPGGIGNDVGPPTGDDGRPLDDTEIREVETQAKLETIQAAKAAKAVGKCPGSIERIVDELVNVTTPWFDILERFMVGKVKDDITWNRLNKRFISQGIHLPGRATKRTMGVAVLVIDSSCSVSQEEFKAYNGHINRILEMCNPELVHVIYCDTKVTGHDEYTADDLPINIRTVAGGGTRFKPAFDYIDDQDLEPEVVVYLTDGECADTNHFTTPYETVWLTTGSTDLAWGTIIKFEE
jgi:predicted metal-dependent peptidase